MNARRRLALDATTRMNRVVVARARRRTGATLLLLMQVGLQGALVGGRAAVAVILGCCGAGGGVGQCKGNG